MHSSSRIKQHWSVTKSGSSLVENVKAPQEAHLAHKSLFHLTSIARNSANHMGPFTILKFRSPSLNGGCSAIKKKWKRKKEGISLSDDHRLLLLPGCYEGSFLLSTLLCRWQSHRSFTRPLVASGCVFQFVTIPETCVYSSGNLWWYWSAEKAKCSSLSKMGCAVSSIKYCQRKWATVSGNRRRLAADVLIEAIIVKIKPGAKGIFQR